MQPLSSWGALLFLAVTGIKGAPLAHADEIRATMPTITQPVIDSFHELETRYIFGFTIGADIGVPGELALESETTAALKKRGGEYSVVEQEIELQGVPSDIFSYELSLHASSHSISSVSDLEDLHRVAFSGVSTDLRFAILDRGPSSPIGLTFRFAPEFARIDGTSGLSTTTFGADFTVIADTEIIPNRLYAAFNLTYTPEVSRTAGDPAYQRASAPEVTGALAYRIAPKITVGGELQYERAYNGLLFNSFVGNALYVGPTLHIQFNSKTMLALAFSSQVAGHAVGDSRSLDLTNFAGHIANMKFEIEF